jgi:hypothetical protein
MNGSGKIRIFVEFSKLCRHRETRDMPALIAQHSVKSIVGNAICFKLGPKT